MLDFCATLASDRIMSKATMVDAMNVDTKTCNLRHSAKKNFEALLDGISQAKSIVSCI